MSRCPDAMKCEATFAKVFDTPNLAPVHPTLSFIGAIERTVNVSATSVTTTVTCKHGPEECAGNTQQLCFKKQHPDHRVWVPFVVGMNSWQPRRIGELQYLREVASRIGGAAADEDKLTLVEQCAQGAEGLELLVQSVQNTLDHHVGTSCTVFVEDKKRCVIDGGVWRECPGGFQVADFVRTINEVAGRVFVSLRTSKLYRIISW
ncbi:hypothetical protein BG003_005527 [Podila horticola]|nr:hypothetical protein BG003_005527 [Podila horticola]